MNQRPRDARRPLLGAARSVIASEFGLRALLALLLLSLRLLVGPLRRPARTGVPARGPGRTR